MKNTVLTSVIAFSFITTGLFSQNENKANPLTAQVKTAHAKMIIPATAQVKKKSAIYDQRLVNIRPLVDNEINPSEKRSAITTSVNVKAYPNPFASELNISVNESSMGNSIYEAVVFDLQGRKIHSEILSAKNTKLNLSGVSAGMYVVHVSKNGNLILQEKIVKQ